jgi:hypothetical protein
MLTDLISLNKLLEGSSQMSQNHFWRQQGRMDLIYFSRLFSFLIIILHGYFSQGRLYVWTASTSSHHLKSAYLLDLTSASQWWWTISSWTIILLLFYCKDIKPPTRQNISILCCLNHTYKLQQTVTRCFPLPLHHERRRWWWDACWL